MRPPFLSLFCFDLLLFRFPLLLPFGKFPLALLALIESQNIRHNAPGDCLNAVLGNIGVVDQLFLSSQMYLRISPNLCPAYRCCSLGRRCCSRKVRSSSGGMLCTNRRSCSFSCFSFAAANCNNKLSIQLVRSLLIEEDPAQSRRGPQASDETGSDRGVKQQISGPFLPRMLHPEYGTPKSFAEDRWPTAPR